MLAARFVVLEYSYQRNNLCMYVIYETWLLLIALKYDNNVPHVKLVFYREYYILSINLEYKEINHNKCTNRYVKY